MTALTIIAQVIAAVATMVAATAALITARAAKRTADRSDLTSERAAEALSRATRPDLADVLLALHGERGGAEPWRVDLVVRNDAPHQGYLLGVRVERADGLLLTEVTGCSLTLQGSYQFAYLALGEVPSARPNPRPDQPYHSDNPEIVCVVRFSDAARLATWRQRCYVHENVGFEERDGRFVPTYRYSAWGRDEPELLAAHTELPGRVNGRLRGAIAVLRGKSVARERRSEGEPDAPS